jgi:hypothetical protein
MMLRTVSFSLVSHVGSEDHSTYSRESVCPVKAGRIGRLGYCTDTSFSALMIPFAAAIAGFLVGFFP